MSVDSDRVDSADALPPGLYHLDPAHTFVIFVRHAIVGRVDGRFNTIAGSFVVTDEPTRRFDLVEVSIEAASVDTKVDARDDDLRSTRFFDIAAFPSLTFRGRSEATADRGLQIVGDLTIRDVVQPVTLDAAVRGAKVDTHGRTRMGATVITALTRRDFGLTTELKQESGDSGEPEIQLRVDIEAVLGLRAGSKSVVGNYADRPNRLNCFEQAAELVFGAMRRGSRGRRGRWSRR